MMRSVVDKDRTTLALARFKSKRWWSYCRITQKY